MSRFAYCHVCDDIRQEVGNKASLIGVYGPNIMVPAFPAAVVKLAFYTVFSADLADPPRTLAVKIETSETVLLEYAIPPDQLAENVAKLQATPEEFPQGRIDINISMVLETLQLDSATILTISVIADSVAYVAKQIRVKTG